MGRKTEHVVAQERNTQPIYNNNTERRQNKMNKITSLAIIAALCAAGASATGEEEHEHEWKNQASASASGKSVSRTSGLLFDAVANTESHADATCYGEDCASEAGAMSVAFAEDGWGSIADSLSMSGAQALIEDTVASADAGVVEETAALGPYARARAHGKANGNAYSYLWKKDTPVGPTPTPPEHKWEHGGDTPVPPEHKPWGYKPWRSHKPRWGYKPKWGY